MAKPILPTPILAGAYAIRFIKTMMRESKHPSKARVKTIKLALEEFQYFRQFL